MRADLLAKLVSEQKVRRPCAVVTEVETGAQRLVRGTEIDQDPLSEQIREQVRLGRSALIENRGVSVFIHVRNPPLRIMVIGAVHIAQALVPIAQVASYEVTIIDPRSAFATQERFPHSKLIAEWPQRVFSGCKLDSCTAMVVLSHVPNIDDEALKAALASDCFYIGALGSRKTNAARLERLRAQNISEASLSRIHAPIGLDIGAIGPSEIAIAIMAEIVATRRQKPLCNEAAA